MSSYKVVNLFGEEVVMFSERKQKNNKNLFSDYEGFEDKFKRKLTTDDCYTPEPVYNEILSYLSEKIDLTDKEILRPFMPDGDFENVPYKANSVVIDNPPFSILAKIVKFYVENNVKFFLFAPHLTSFSNIKDVTAVVCGVNIVYENGAKINTSFLTNMLGDFAVISDLELFNRLDKFDKVSNPLPKYKYPKNVLTVNEVYKMMRKGVGIRIPKNECLFVRELDSQKLHKKGIFGAGLLISNRIAKERKEAEYLSYLKNGSNEDNVVEWELSEREKTLIKGLEPNKTIQKTRTYEMGT